MFSFIYFLFLPFFCNLFYFNTLDFALVVAATAAAHVLAVVFGVVAALFCFYFC